MPRFRHRDHQQKQSSNNKPTPVVNRNSAFRVSFRLDREFPLIRNEFR